MRSSRLEVGGVTEEIPTICEFARAAEIVTSVKRLPWLPGLQCQNGVDLPAFQQLPPCFDIRQGISSRKGETMPDIKIVAAVFATSIEAVFRQVLVPIVRLIIQPVGIRIANDKVQAMVIAAGEGSLQTIVI